MIDVRGRAPRHNATLASSVLLQEGDALYTLPGPPPNDRFVTPDATKGGVRVGTVVVVHEFECVFMPLDDVVHPDLVVP